MKQCLRITVRGKVQGVGYREYIQKNAQALELEGTVQNDHDGNVTVNVCGAADRLDKFIDKLYKGNTKSKVDDVVAEPLMQDRDFRGVFRIIGFE